LSFAFLAGTEIASAGAADPNDSFHYFVEDAAGEVYAWSNLEAGWLRVTKKSILADGSLIQSNGAMKIQAVRTAEGSKERGQQIVVESQGSIMFRLTPALSRDFELANYFVKKSSDLEVPSMGEEEQMLSIRDAWEKVLALISAKGAKKKGGDNLKFGKGKSQEVRTEVQGTVLTITYPAKGGVFVPENFPVDVPVIWGEPQNKPELGSVWSYEVFLKATEDSEYKRVARTKDSNYTLQILKEGSYSVMVSSPNGNAKSEETLFSVFPADAEVWKKIPSKKRETKSPATNPVVH